MTAKPSYEELERRVQELEKIESEHKYSRETLQKNESSFEVLYEKAPLSYQSLDENGHFIVVNQAWLDTLGYTREEVIGKSFADFLHPDWRDHFKENFPRFKSIGEILGVEFEMVKKNGDLILVSFTGKISRDNKGNFQQTHCIFHDITERKRIEQKLVDRTKRLDLAQSAANLGVWDWDVVTGHIEWSDQMFNLFGLNPQKSTASFETWRSVLHPEDVEIAGQRIDKALKGQTRLNSDYRILLPDGQIRCINAVGEGEYDSQGRPVRMLGICMDITERKRSEEELRDSEERFRRMFHRHNAIMLLIDQKTGAIRDANHAAAMFYGYSTERLCQMTIQEINALPAEEVAHQRTLAITEKRNCFIFPHRLANGEVKTVEVHSSPITTRDETFLFSIIHDITERRKAEEALHKSEANYKQLFDNSPAGIYQINFRTGKFLKANDVICEYFGCSQEDIPSLSPYDFITQESQKILLERLNKMAMGDKVPEDPEYEIVDKNGKRRWIKLNSHNYYDSEGLAGADVVAHDITDRKQAEDTVRESEKRYRQLFDASPEAIILIDPEGCILDTNITQGQMYRYDSPSDLVGVHALQLVAPSSRDHAAQIMRRRLSGEDIPAVEYECLRKDGTTFYGEITATILHKTDGAVSGYICIIHDVTDRKQAEEQLQQTLESLRKSFAATIQVMVSAVESRDPYTSGHQTRSADLARAIATEMELPQDVIEGLRMAGSIHDIGKLSIPAEILSKPTKLTNLEFSLIKEHSRKGYEMLKDVESPWPLAEIIFQHHERIDGSGYPRNLKGEEILIEARILMVADVVEAMASHRPYRPGLGIEAALNEIEKNRGIFYDEAVVDACLRLFREKGFKLEGT